MKKIQFMSQQKNLCAGQSEKSASASAQAPQNLTGTRPNYYAKQKGITK